MEAIKIQQSSGMNVNGNNEGINAIIGRQPSCHKGAVAVIVLTTFRERKDG